MYTEQTEFHRSGGYEAAKLIIKIYHLTSVFNIVLFLQMQVLNHTQPVTNIMFNNLRYGLCFQFFSPGSQRNISLAHLSQRLWGRLQDIHSA